MAGQVGAAPADRSVVRVALGAVPADLLIEDVRLADVLTGEVRPAEIAIAGDRVAAVEPPGTLPRREARRRLSGGGRLAVPGLVDSHLHIESTLVGPAAFARAVLPLGTTTVAEDPHEVANAAGLEGVRVFLEASRGLPLDILFLASPCVPAARGLERARGALGPAEIEAMLGWEGVLGLAEVMDARAVVDEDPHLTAILEVAREAGGVLEGHNPMLEGRELQAYVAAGVDSDHTLVGPARLLEKLRLGVTVQLQERYLTPELIQAVVDLPHPPPTLCLVTDDVAPDYLETAGHLDQVLRRAIELGLPPMQALQAATINPARRLRLFDRGAVVPGRRADLALVDGLESFRVWATVSAGRVVVEEGRTAWEQEPLPDLDKLRGSLELEPPDAEAFRPDLPRDGEVSVRVIEAAEGTLTRAGRAELRVAGGEPDLGEDLALVAVLARGGVGRFVGLVRGLGLRRGALATTYAHDSHNLTVIGRDRPSMAAAARAVVEADGGMAVAEGETVAALVPLPLAGILSDREVPEVAGQVRQLVEALEARGLRHAHPLMRLSTLTLTVASGLRISDLGYVDAGRRSLLPLLLT